MAINTNSLPQFIEEIQGQEMSCIKDIYNISQFPEVKDSIIIKQEYNERSIGELTRVLITVNKQYIDFRSSLTRYCNGIVINWPNKQVLAIPPPMLTERYNRTRLAASMNNYVLYEINDGTTVTLYWHNNAWRMATANGYDVSDYTWIGELTYKELFDEVAREHDFNYDNLDKHKSYTIGFRHENTHPLLADGRKMWLIQSCDVDLLNRTNTLVISYEDDIGIPIQIPVDIPARGLDDIIERNNYALANYERTQFIHYGYILRSCNDGVDFVLPSELLKKIKHLIYNLPKNNGIIPAVRRDYIILRGCLLYDRDLFVKLFPQFNEKIMYYEDIFSKITDKITNALQYIDSQSELVADDTIMDKNVTKLAKILLAQIINTGSINVMDNVGPKIVADFVTSKKHLELYSNILLLE